MDTNNKEMAIKQINYRTGPKTVVNKQTIEMSPDTIQSNNILF